MRLSMGRRVGYTWSQHESIPFMHIIWPTTSINVTGEVNRSSESTAVC